MPIDGKAASIYVDTHAFISALESRGDRSEGMWRVFDARAQGESRGLTSEVTLAELLPKPLSLGQSALRDAYTALLSGDGVIHVIPVTRSLLLATAALRARQPSLKLPDAIHLATAEGLGCVGMLTDDLQPALPEGMKAVRLGPDSLETIRRFAP